MDILETARRHDPVESLKAIGAQLTELEGLLDRPREELSATRPEVSGWSPGEHLFHMILACELSLKNAEALARDEGRLVREPAERSAEGLDVLREGRIPRGVAQAPRFVQPPKRIDFDLLVTLLGDVRNAHGALAADPDRLRQAPRTVPHQLLGDLSCAEWLRFAQVHTDHHLAIVAEILG